MNLFICLPFPWSTSLLIGTVCRSQTRLECILVFDMLVAYILAQVLLNLIVALRSVATVACYSWIAVDATTARDDLLVIDKTLYLQC